MNTPNPIDPAKLPRNEQMAYYYRGLRTRMGYSQKQLAEQLGVDIRTVQRREKAEMLVTYESMMAILYIFVQRYGFDPINGGQIVGLLQPALVRVHGLD
jgi:transcriptional regulator with XRE-family HTH domain